MVSLPGISANAEKKKGSRNGATTRRGWLLTNARRAVASPRELLFSAVAERVA